MEEENQSIELNEMDTNENEPHQKTLLESKNVENEKKSINNKCKLALFFGFLCLLCFIIIIFISKIDNNIEKNKRVIQLLADYIIKKDLLKHAKSFISCIGPPGSGKSTFGSNYYKKIYNLKNNYFEISEGNQTHTKGIWIISDEERRKITNYLLKDTHKDILDVEGFQVDETRSWKYVNIVTFLSTDIIILNRNESFVEVRRIIKIIENCLKQMQQIKIPCILKNIYIQIVKHSIPPIEELLEAFNYNKTVFKMIKFQYMYLPDISTKKEKDLLKYLEYNLYFENILKILDQENNYNSVSSIMNYIDIFNGLNNGNTLFNSQTIYNAIESDFNEVYNKHKNKLKNELFQKIPYLIKIDNLYETFDDFINKQINLTFEFDINNENFTFYGGCQNYNNIYEDLKKKKKKNFRVDPKDIFLDFFESEELRLLEEQEILDEYEEKKRKIDDYFAYLKFYQDDKINDNYLKIEIDNDQKEYKKMN